MCERVMAAAQTDLVQLTWTHNAHPGEGEGDRRGCNRGEEKAGERGREK